MNDFTFNDFTYIIVLKKLIGVTLLIISLLINDFPSLITVNKNAYIKLHLLML